MGVYYNLPRYVATGSKQTSARQFSNTITRPVTIDGVRYDASNPLYRVIARLNSGEPYYWSDGVCEEIYVQATEVSGTKTLQKGVDYWHGFNTLIYAPTSTTTVVGYKQESNKYGVQNGVFISGKYRLRKVLSANPHFSLVLGTVCVNFAVKGKNYTGIMFAGTGTFNFNGCNKSQNTSVYSNIALYAGYPEYNEIPDYDLLTEGGGLLGEFSEVIFDFGTTPQEVPYMFNVWLTENFDYVYPYTFVVKAQNGIEQKAILDFAPAMVDAIPSVVGNVKTLTMTGVNGQTYTMTWESETPAGKQFLGLSYGANETRASIPTGTTTPVTWDGSLTIYEVYGTYRPLVTTFDINLYQNSAEVNRVDKTDYLTGVGTLSGVLREECSIIAPSITFKQTTVPTFNYVYIAAFGRYYYVTGITSVSKDMWRMSLSCDVLMTWKDDIKALTAIIARQENSFNPLLLDSELPAQANQNITVTEFPAGGFSTAGTIEHPFLLTVVGA